MSNKVSPSSLEPSGDLSGMNFKGVNEESRKAWNAVLPIRYVALSLVDQGLLDYRSFALRNRLLGLATCLDCCLAGLIL